ncbi:hypothetical protein J7F01_19915 [Streptomyces sp. ISL-22]|uniref:hypothetical protein n=1 Tax=unclassified Streptomyces TaxID=2593676 RepID=UPI001BEB967A|nr:MULTISPECIES: hypothetical protein [unclassified Streptomyces]MBT2418497.1 hypothetical protein [Streptomyces sp. ISL-24]MBT2434400.1 hypothetical protein [Streptomyces sp. ISL-22]
MRRTRTRRRATAVAAAVTAAAPLLGACGIQETDVIEAGGPASFQAFLNRDHDMLLFFRSPDGGLSPVIRTTEPSAGFGDEYVEPGSADQNGADTAGPVPTEKAVLALLAGPREEDRAAGLSTSLPATRPGGTVEVEPPSNGKVTTRLPLALEDLNSTALHQLTCTIAYSHDADGQVVVELTDQDGTSRTGTCGLAPRNSGEAPAEPGPSTR